MKIMSFFSRLPTVLLFIYSFSNDPTDTMAARYARNIVEDMPRRKALR